MGGTLAGRISGTRGTRKKKVLHEEEAGPESQNGINERAVREARNADCRTAVRFGTNQRRTLGLAGHCCEPDLLFERAAHSR